MIIDYVYYPSKSPHRHISHIYDYGFCDLDPITDSVCYSGESTYNPDLINDSIHYPGELPLRYVSHTSVCSFHDPNPIIGSVYYPSKLPPNLKSIISFF